MEETKLGAHTLPYAIHKREADQTVQMRAPAMTGCSVYILRPHIFAGASMENYLVGAFRGTPNGKGRLGKKFREQGKRLPCMLPSGEKYVKNKIQFVHVDDIARLLAHIVRIPQPAPQRVTILNVAGRGEPLTFGRCVEIARNKLIRPPARWTFDLILSALWSLGISAIPPEAAPYMTGEYIMDTSRLRAFLGDQYESVIQFTNESAFADTFREAKISDPVKATASAT